MDITQSSNPNPRRRELGTFFTYGACLFALGLSMSVVGPTLPTLADNVGVSLARISFIFTTSSLGYLLGSSGGGRLYDRLKGHRIMLVAMIFMLTSGVLIPVTHSFYALLGVVFLFGLGQGLIDIGANLGVLWVFKSRVGPYMNALHFFFGLGAFISPIIVTNVMRWSGGTITWPFWVLGILYLPGLIGLLIYPSPDNSEKEKDGEMPQKINYKLVIPIIVLFFLYVGVEASFGGWIYTYATGNGISGEAGASYLNSLYWGALMAGRLITVPLSRKVEASKILVGNYILMALFLLMILVWPVNSVMVWVASIGLGFAVSSVFPTLLALAETRMKVTGAITGLFFLGTSLGGMIVPTVLGQIFEYVGSYQAIQTLFLGACLGLGVLIIVIVASNRMGERTRG
jgi:FHS family Na+ dependent glucose MFS transporter 1